MDKRLRGESNRIESVDDRNGMGSMLSVSLPCGGLAKIRGEEGSEARIMQLQR